MKFLYKTFGWILIIYCVLTTKIKLDIELVTMDNYVLDMEKYLNHHPGGRFIQNKTS